MIFLIYVIIGVIIGLYIVIGITIHILFKLQKQLDDLQNEYYSDYGKTQDDISEIKDDIEILYKFQK